MSRPLDAVGIPADEEDEDEKDDHEDPASALKDRCSRWASSDQECRLQRLQKILDELVALTDWIKSRFPLPLDRIG